MPHHHLESIRSVGIQARWKQGTGLSTSTLVQIDQGLVEVKGASQASSSPDVCLKQLSAPGISKASLNDLVVLHSAVFEHSDAKLTDFVLWDGQH